MATPTSDLPTETISSQNPSIVQDQEQENQQDPHSDSQLSKTITFEAPYPQKPVQSDPNPQNADGPDTISVLSLRSIDTNVGVSTATSRRRSKRKKLDKRGVAREKKTETKLQVLLQTLNPIPFIPIKALDFSRHEKLLKRFRLWDFVHIEFDKNINGDLIAQLIARYKPISKDSYVNGLKVSVSRADLARALKLPLKKCAVSDGGMEGLELAESIGFLEEFVSNWVLLHEDTWIMPEEVVRIMNMLKEGNLEKVDWAGLIWFMVEKELVASSLVNCYYASHLQQLIRSQREQLLIEKPKVEVEVEVEVKDEEEEVEENGSDDVKMGEVDDSREHELVEHRIELCLGQDNVDKAENQKEPDGIQDIMDFEEAKEDGPMQWLLDGKNNMSEPFLRHCHIDGLKDLDCGKENKDEEDEEGEEGEEEEEEAEEDEHDGGFHISPKCIPLEGMASGSLIQAMEVSQMPFNSGIELRDHSGGEFLSSREDTRLSGASLFANGNKREIGHDHLNPHHSLNGSKRLRSDGVWDGKSADFDLCMEQVDHWMEKARIMYAAKDQACEESSLSQQYLINEVQQRDSVIEHLHKEKMDESQKRLAEIYRLGRELHMMESLVEGYRKALKETQRAFDDYRIRCPQRDEPVYRDVPGSGGLVLSTMELEKQRWKQEEEERMNRLIYEKKFRDFELGWIAKLDDYRNIVQSLDDRLLDSERVVKLLTEVNTRKVLDSSECAAN
ncbi:DNA ligase 1 [Quillaja saponaria]|uniref:DNA ligase 1 n=1 Tax=Quillaja saponaria TaxID=32244 RepID=A0AAD7QHC3_QUISA|nr:DNA ligase 1 [Quillaja saponaria]